MGEKVKLYSKIGREKRIRFVDPVKKTVLYNKPTLFLHPTKPTEVSKEDAEHLLKQDPHLVSTKPFEGEDFDENEVLERSKPRNYEAQAMTEDQREQIIGALQELSEMDVSKLKAADIDRFAKIFGVKFPPKTPFMTKKKEVFEAANKLAKEFAK